MQIIKTNVVPKATGELVVPNAMKEKLVLEATTNTGCRRIHLTVIE
jgi:hypothetical protein